MLKNNPITMSKLFEYSKIAEENDFIGREDEVKKISSNFIFLTNTALLAPQGWGKSSLMHRAAQEARHKEKNLRFCFLNLSNVRSEERFYEILAQGVLKAVSKNQDEVVNNVKKFFPHTSPRITFDASGDFIVDFDWEEIRQNQDELLDLPHSVAKTTGMKLVVCVDEFNAISLFNDPETLLERFSRRWSRHDGVAYCIASTPLVFVEKFLKSTPMFYRYGDIINVGHIRRKDIVKAIREKFADNAKYLDNEIAGFIAELVGDHAFYTQQLAHLSWLTSSVVCSKEVVQQAHETIVDQMELVFRLMTDNLTTQQLCYLHAVLAGETVISTSEVLHRHHITSATSASRSKATLLEKGIVCNVDGCIVFADPIYAYWLKNRYFAKK